MSQTDTSLHQSLGAQAADSLQQHGLTSLEAQQQDGSYLQQHQSQHEEGSQEATQPDMLTQQLHQVLVTDTARFWQATVAPSAQNIFQASCTSG